jgi:sulfatase-like protein/neutral/alkaline ceramidase-like enzyme
MLVDRANGKCQRLCIGRDLLRSAAMVAVLTLPTSDRVVASTTVNRPNVLFIAVDDLRPELGCYGTPTITSPHIDALAQVGTVFTRAYCQQAICGPSRTSVLTGCRPDKTRVYDCETHFRLHRPDLVTLPQYFKKCGYHTRSFGKMFHDFLDDPPSWSVRSWAPQDQMYGKPENQAALKWIKEHRESGVPAFGPAWEDPDVPDIALRDGTSRAPLLDDPDRLGAEAAFSQYPRGKAMGYSMRTERFRYTEWAEPGQSAIGVELYDHKDDPREDVNLAGRPEHKDLIEQLGKQMYAGRICPEDIPVSRHSETSDDHFDVGVGRVDITPTEEVTLAGSPSPKKTSVVDTPLFVKAMVISSGERRVAIVTVDTLKYFTEFADQARKHVEATTGIPAGNVIICVSHTHRGPLCYYYEDRLVTPIGKAVALAVRDLTPCRMGTSTGTVEGVSENRRLLKEGEAWNRWLVKPSERDDYPALGPADPEVGVLAAVRMNGDYKAILYNFACHPTSTQGAMISADYPGHVQQYVEEHLGYEVPTLLLTGACGDVNPNDNKTSHVFGSKLGEEILKSLGSIEYTVEPTLWIESREQEMPGRERPEFKGKEIARKWPGQLEHYRRAFEAMKRREKPTYKFHVSGIRIGDDFAIVTNPDELFCEIGMNIKEHSPFKHTMVAQQTNGARGYVPTARAFEEGGYETWYGEHSYLSIRAGEIVRSESLGILRLLKNEE